MRTKWRRNRNIVGGNFHLNSYRHDDRFYHSSRDWDVRARLLYTTTTTWRWHCLNFIGSFVCARRMTKWLTERVLLDALSSCRSTIAFTPRSREHTTPVRPSQNPKRCTCLFPLLSVFDHYSDASSSHPLPLTHARHTSLSIVQNKRSCRIRRRRNPFAPVPSAARKTGQAKIGIIVFARDLPRTSGPKRKTTQTTFVGK